MLKHSDQKFIYLINRRVALRTHCSSGSLKKPTNERQQNIKSWLRFAFNTFRCTADDSVGQSVHHTHGLLGTREKENHQNITEVAERQLQVKRGEPWCSMVLGHKLGSDHPWLSQPGEGSDNQIPRTPDDPAFSLFTDDVSKLPVRADGVS